MPDTGLDADKLAALERWGTGLQGDPRPEVAASGRAILMLIDEVERLHVLLWGRALFPQETIAPVEPEPEADMPTTLRQLLRHRRRTKATHAASGGREHVIHSQSTPPAAPPPDLT